MQAVLNKAFGEKTDLSLITAKAVILRDREVLLIKKSKGQWDLPGGRIDPGETIYQGLLREVKEETGIDVSVDHFLTAIDRSSHATEKGPLFAFICTTDDKLRRKLLKLSSEHVDSRFENLWHADHLPMNESNLSILSAAQHFIETI